eukprot:scaffold430_cov73-Skeletonema_marinoi.AAC.4
MKERLLSIWQSPSRDCLTLTRVNELGLRHFEAEGEAEVAHVGNPLSHRGLRDFVTTPLSAAAANKIKSEGLEGKQMPLQTADVSSERVFCDSLSPRTIFFSRSITRLHPSSIMSNVDDTATTHTLLSLRNAETTP